MAFTGQIGGATSELANIELGSPGSSPRTSQTIQAKANIFNRSSQTIQARARINATVDQSVQALARIPLFVSIVTDSFNRADTVGSLGVADSGQTWSNDTSLHYVVNSNQAAATGASAAGGAEIDSTHSGTNAFPLKVAVDCILDATNATGVIFRSGGPSDNNRFFAYLIQVSGAYNIRLLRELGGSFSGGTLVDQPVTGATLNVGETHRIQVLAVGSGIYLFVDGVLQATVTDTNLLTNTWHGVFLDGTSGRLDNFNVDVAVTAQSIQVLAHILNFVTTDRSIQALARLTGQITHQIRAKAALTPQTIRQIQAKANLLSVARQTIQALARIAPSISAKASIVVPVTANLEIDFLVQVAAVADLLITFDATILTRAIQSVMAKAHIMLPVATDLTITFDAGCPMPGLPILRPTERVRFRGIAQVSAKASIR